MTDAAANPRMIIRENTMKPFQWVAVGLCVAMTALDGFDVLSVSFVGPELREVWNIGATEIGYLVSAGLFGMVVGALVFSPVADIIGRRNVLLISLAIIAVGMFASAFTTSVAQLVPLRFFAGFGIGTMFAPVNSMAVEYASNKRKGLAVGLNVAGYPLGTTLGGLLSLWLVPTFGWQSVFFLGAGLTALLIPLVILFMPESMEFLLSKRPKTALPKLNILMTKLGREPLKELPPPDDEAKAAGGLSQILKQPYLSRVITIISCYFVIISAFYFVSGLTPTILAQAGFPATLARVGTISVTVGGMLGSLMFGVLAARFPIKHLTSAVAILSVLAMALFGHLAFNIWLLFVGAILIGFFVNSAIAGCYSAMAVGFPAHLRATGSGFTLGIGRFGAVVGPLIGGLMSDAGMDFVWIYTLVGLPVLMAALFMQVLSIGRLQAVPQDDLSGGFIAIVSGVAVGAVTFAFRPPGVLEGLLARPGFTDFTIQPLWFYVLAATTVVLLAGGLYLLVRPKAGRAVASAA